MRPFVHFKTHQKVISLFLIVSFIVIPLSVFTFPKKAEAVCTPFSNPPIPDPFSVPVHDSSASVTKQADHVIQGNMFFKNCILDGIAIVIAKTIIKQLTKSIINWIQSGFKGNPSFVQDPQGFFTGVADKVAGNVIENIAPFLCSPFRLNIQLALALNQTGGDDLSCSLTDVEKNFNDFVNGSISASASWDNWFKITQNPENNPYGAMMIAQAKLSAEVESAQSKYEQQLDWGNGFFGFEDCPSNGDLGTYRPNAADAAKAKANGGSFIGSYNTQTDSTLVQNKSNTDSLASIGSLGLLDSIFGGDSNEDSLAAPVYVNGKLVPTVTSGTSRGKYSPTQANLNNMEGEKNYDTSKGYITDSGIHTNPNNPKDRTIYDANDQAVYGLRAGENGCLIKTPGAIIEGQLDNLLGSDLRGLEIAQSIDQIVAALAGQLLSQALGGIGGLMGAGSNSSGSSSGSNFDYQKSITAAGGGTTMPDLPVTGACTPNKQTAQIGEQVIWNAYVPDLNGKVTYTWYGDDGLTGSRASATTSYTTNGTKTASVLVTTTSDTSGQMIDCTPSIEIGGTSSTTLAPTISCSASPSTVSINTPVTWQTVVVGGVPPFIYSWQGDDGLTGSGQSTIKSYTTASATPKTATVYVTDAEGYTYSHACYGAVLVTP